MKCFDKFDKTFYRSEICNIGPQHNCAPSLARISNLIGYCLISYFQRTLSQQAAQNVLW